MPGPMLKRPELSEFDLTEDSLRGQRLRRGQLHFLMVPLALSAGVANWALWLAADQKIGNWSLLGLFLSGWGLIPAVVVYVLLDSLFGRYFYRGLQRYERAKNRFDRWFAKTQLAFWDSLSGRQFEHEVAALLNRAGRSAAVTPASGDGGVDVRLTDGTIIQCKTHKTAVSPGVARELYGTLQHLGAPRAILVSKNGFSRGVYEFVRGKNIELWDVKALITMQRNLEG